MGKVFSWQEIATGRVPKLASFDDILDLLRREIKVTDGILGGLILGSVLTGLHNRRSDIDCLVIYDLAKEYQVREKLKDLHWQAKRLDVPLGLIAIDHRLAATPLHHISYSFSKHLALSAKNGGVIKANPLEFLNFCDRDLTGHLKSYLQFKLRFLGSGMIKLPEMTQPLRCRYFQKMLGLPVHVARKILIADNWQVEDDSRRWVVDKYLDRFNDRESGLPMLFRELVGLDELYSSELTRQLERFDERGYGRIMAKLELAAPDFYGFARQIALKFQT